MNSHIITGISIFASQLTPCTDMFPCNKITLVVAANAGILCCDNNSDGRLKARLSMSEGPGVWKADEFWEYRHDHSKWGRLNNNFIKTWFCALDEVIISFHANSSTSAHNFLILALQIPFLVAGFFATELINNPLCTNLVLLIWWSCFCRKQ